MALALTETRICNMALIKIGADRISSRTQNKKEAKVCNQYYDNARDHVLRVHPWNFAVARSALTALSTAPISDYAYQYQLPTSPKCLRVLEITESSGDWVVEGDYLLTDDSPVEIRFIQRITDTSKFDPAFAETLACYLAYQIALSITESLQIQQTKYAEYRRQLQEARGADNLERAVLNDEPDLWTD